MTCIGADAQVYINLDMLQKNQNVTVEMVLQDARTKDPISYATVYLVPQGDTTITNFALSDAKGKVRIEDVISGKYQVNAEMIGYKPYMKVHDLTGWDNDLGFIRLEENPEYIDAATITALANPVTVKKDTLEYNAAAFHVGENAVLEDLLKKMPGMEVGEDGTVKVNGEAVDKITVGGKTFFFNDPSMALKNLPAKVVDKIKVIDRDKDEAAFSGVSTQSDREKVMDVQLKEEYKEGWFGNAGLSGGSTLGKDPDNEFQENIGALFNANAMAAWYNETDQVTILANGKNADTPGGSSAIVVTDEILSDDFIMKAGQVTSAQAGANYNTERVKGMEIGANVSYTYSNKDAKEKSFRTSFQPDGSRIVTDGRYNGSGTDNKLSGGVEIGNKDKSKYLFDFNPSVSFTSRDRAESNSSSTAGPSGEGNSSSSTKSSHTNVLRLTYDLEAGIKDMGKTGRSLTFASYAIYRKAAGTSMEKSETLFPDAVDARNHKYDNKGGNLRSQTYLTYVEPLSDKWALQTRFETQYVTADNTKLAFNGADGSANDYYSSWSHNRDLTFSERIYAQYKKSEDFSLLFGATLFEENNVTESRTTGIDSAVGEGEWLMKWAPYAEMNWSKGFSNIRVSYAGYNETPSGTSIIPSLDISNPVFVSTGNIYLKPSFSQYASLNFSGSSPKNASFYDFSVVGMMTSNATVYASWFDANGIRNSIPVNSRKPTSQLSLYGTFGAPLDQKKRLSLSVNSYLDIGSRVNYQANGTLPGFDKDRFDYDGMMRRFWGNPSGDIFYSGRSGFAESRTTTISWVVTPKITYRRDRFSADGSVMVENEVSRYTLDPKADMNVWDFRIRGNVLYTTRNGFEFGTDASYWFYKGYSNGYGTPELIWNARISKTVKSVVFSIACADILNQNRSLSRTASGEYYQDTYSNVLGRYFLFGISFNFGKMNAKNNSRVQDAMYRMILN